jgi:hypothetical protein
MFQMTKRIESEIEQAAFDILRDALLPKLMNGEIAV